MDQFVRNLQLSVDAQQIKCVYLRVFGCAFHFKKNVNDHVNKGLAALRNACPEFRKLVHMIHALVWAPPEDIPGMWMSLKNFCAGKLFPVAGMPNHSCFEIWQENMEELQAFLRYFKLTWVGDRASNTNPIFKPEQWSAYRTIIDSSIPSTQSGNEGYNNAFKV